MSIPQYPDFENMVENHILSSYVLSTDKTDLIMLIKKLSIHKKKIVAKENSIYLFKELLLNIKKTEENLVLNNLYIIFTLLSDHNENVRMNALQLVEDILKFFTVNSTKAVQLLEHLVKLTDCNYKSATKINALKSIATLTDICPEEVKSSLTEVIPLIAQCLVDLNEEIHPYAIETLKQLCNTINNSDIEPFVDKLIDVFKNRDQATEVIHNLAGVTFVQDVDSASLSIIVPVLIMGFNDKLDSTKRLSAVIVSNMIKLVNDPRNVASYVARLIEVLDVSIRKVAEPEARSVCTKAFNSLNILNNQILNLPKSISIEDINVENNYIKNLVYCLVKIKNFNKDVWVNNLNGYIELDIINEVFEFCFTKSEHNDTKEEIDDAEQLCDCNFTLAYGSKILLHNTRLTLKRGYRYGLLGGNDSGKSTLLRAIANEQLDGFPPSSQLKTVFVEADIQGEISHLSCLDYIFADQRIQRCGVPRIEVQKVMESVGFSEKMCNDPVSTLSGGWRMKLALSRAMIQKADILLLDEPTNHLDVINVAWVENYLCSLDSITCIIVSHNRGLLDKCCTHILKIDNCKLYLYKGNLSDLTKIDPNVQSYFQMKSTKGLKFKFPNPGFVDGVKSRGMPLMKIDNVNFTYPSNTTPTLTGISIRVSLSSRVACLGVNGAGKSTLIKILTGELVPSSGSVWKKSGVRFAYVAQHAFHHIENHINKTPNEYICWRYENGYDKETLVKDTFALTDDEYEKIKQPIELEIKDVNGKITRQKRIFDRLTGNRRTVAKDLFEYEVSWQQLSDENNMWFSPSRLEAMGFGKPLKNLEIRLEASFGLSAKPITYKTVEEYLKNFGMEPEYGSHTRMSALSNSLKVKAVFAAAMWPDPHILILDEPTNYLDRDSLIALAEAVNEYGGGVVIITHNDEFCKEICKETWVVEAGRLNVHGDEEWMKNALSSITEFKQVEEMVDKYGNIEKVKITRELSNKEKKAMDRRRKLKLKNGEPISDEDADYS